MHTPIQTKKLEQHTEADRLALNEGRPVYPFQLTIAYTYGPGINREVQPKEMHTTEISHPMPGMTEIVEKVIKQPYYPVIVGAPPVHAKMVREPIQVRLCQAISIEPNSACTGGAPTITG